MSFIGLLLESEGNPNSSNLTSHESEEDLSWQLSFAEIGVDPLSLTELKLTRQNACYFNDENDLKTEINL